MILKKGKRARMVILTKTLSNSCYFLNTSLWDSHYIGANRYFLFETQGGTTQSSPLYTVNG